MLLQRLYNWIKYKSLPTSFLFKNRLFIERNTKHRRIYSIFGALIRNSKWGNFELSNLKVQFRLNYTKYLLWIFFFFALTFLGWFFKKYYLYTYSFNSVALFIWLSVDAFDYYLSFGIWCVTAFIAITTNWIYSYFLERVSFKRISFKTIFSDIFFENLIRSEDVEQPIIFTSIDLKHLFYSWISETNPLNKPIFLENFFNSEINKNQWIECYDFFIKLFKLTYLCNLSNESHTIKHLHYTFSHFYPSYLNSNCKNLFLHYTDINITNKYSTLIFWYVLNNYTNYYSHKSVVNPSLRLLRTKNSWNLSSFNTEITKSYILNTNLSGNFYLSSFSFNELSHYSNNIVELWNFSSYIKNQLNTAKWNRWLYKYSILHRRFLKNSHKITLTKKLFASGFYDNKYFSKNTWNSAHLKGLNKKFIHNLSSVYYKNLFTPTSKFVLQTQNLNTLRSFTTKENINLFAFYENSYLWVAKRFYLFNTIPSNIFSSTISIKNNSTHNLNNSNRLLKFQSKTIWYSILNSYINNSYLFNVNNFLLFDLSQLNNIDYCFDDASKKLKNNYYLKDLYLLFDDNDLLTQENLDANYWITNGSSTINSNSWLSNYLINNLFYRNNYNFSFLMDYNKTNLYSISINNNVSIDRLYLFDMILLSYFY